LLGYYYKTAKYQAINLEASFTWYKVSAQAGEVHAMYITGWNLYKGYGCEADRQKALSWLYKAESSGSVEAKELIYFLE
jgi:TPR repeat protein